MIGDINHPDLYEVDLEPIGRRVNLPPLATLLYAAQTAGVELSSVCGGVGTCGTCKVRLVRGELTPPTADELAELSEIEIQSGIRLACQAKIMGSVLIDIPPGSLTTPQRLQVEGKEVRIDLDPVVIPVSIKLDSPDLQDLRSDLTRLLDYTSANLHQKFTVNYPVLVSLSECLRGNAWEVTLAVRGDTIVSVLPKDTELLGLAVDVGTTKLAAYLVNLKTGETLAKAGAMNPQIAFGEDVISRISFTNDNPDGRKILQQKLIQTLNEVIHQLTVEAGVSGDQIVEAVIVGNTAMHHLLAGLSVSQLGAAPYVPAVSDAMDLPAEEIGLKISPGAIIFLPPNIAGYVGADHVSMLIGAEAAQEKHDVHTIVSLDIGTNTEISLYHWGRHLSCSCASGPAFEGAHISDGMRAAPGAIERVRMEDGTVLLQTIGGLPAVGICGSGILDAVAGLRTIQVIDERGVFKGDHPGVHKQDGKPEFILVDEAHSGTGRKIVVNRRDVNEIQLAKGAIRAGLEVLLTEVGITDHDIDEFIIAGAFGTYLNLESAISIGMFPDIPRERFHQVGNAAGLGAKGMLISSRLRAKANEIIKDVEYIELTTNPYFTEAYMVSLAFKDE
jgi:uncharacterized 2Fe-2S/4Fe-4S cluster protein (DUF4445 family)